MEKTAEKPATQNTPLEKVRASQLMAMLDAYGPRIKILSLDCFDTILWRRTATPKGVFLDLQNRPTFKACDFSSVLRINAEFKARLTKSFTQNTIEVSLRDIYLAQDPSFSKKTLTELAEEELAAEMDACYAFYPIVELIRAAHARGIKIIIVSDTYFQESQLRKLLSHLLPQDVMSAIYKIFCSCEHGRSKSAGLFHQVLKATNQAKEAILHLGDNLLADFTAPRALNIPALHFIQKDDCVTDVLTMQTVAAKMLDPKIGSERAIYNPYHGIFSMREITPTMPEALIGYVSLGPIMYAFAQYLVREIEELKQAGKNPKILFLMRDAYLPSLACEAFLGEPLGKRVRISRFASFAASFRTKEDVESYLVEFGNTNRFHDVARQLLLPEKVSEPLITTAQKSPLPIPEFMRLVCRPDVLRIILNKSAEYRARLMHHLENEVSLEKGDTLVLVDLGYSGTAQRRLMPVFADMGIDVVGRYLISLRVPQWKDSRRGLLDPSWCDDNTMYTLVVYISMLEQLCTSNEKSVVDYDEHGHAVYSEISMSHQQHVKLANIQAECLQFIKDARNFFSSANFTISETVLRDIALSEMGRLIYLPSEIELDFLKSFQAEMNLGTSDILRVFDAEEGLIGLRKRGMFYMEKPSKTTRTNYPAELRVAGFELSLALITQHRFGLEMTMKDMVMRKLVLDIVFARGNETYNTTVEAVPTHDGYFAMWLPASNQVAILLGKKYQWVQLESADLISMDAFINKTETNNTKDIWQQVGFHQMTDKGGRLFECLTTDSAVIINPTAESMHGKFVVRVVFRPTVARLVEQVENVSYSATL